MHGACEEGVAEDVCNPRSDENGVPTDSLVANLFMIALLPIVFKAHTTNALVGSYLLTFIGVVASAIIANATSDVVMIFGCIFAFGIMMYDHKRNMLTMFLMLQDQQSYYDQLLAMERNRASAVIEKDELRNLIGNVAHDLKTPIQALMVEVDGLQVEIDSIMHLFPADSPHYDSVSHLTNESQKYIDSLRDIYQFAMMAINRAIEFRKTAAGLALMPVDETFHLPHAIGWAVKRFADNPSGVKIRYENYISNIHRELCPYVTSDKHWMMEHMLTLLSNACKFTSKGDIVVRTDIVTSKSAIRPEDSFLSNNGESQLPRSTVHFDDDMNMLYERKTSFEGNMTSNPDGEYFVRIVVEDTGIGVPKDAVSGLFQPHSHSKRLTGGTGLGLFSLAKHSEVLKGACGMYTRSDGLSGCGFWFTFPYRPDLGAWMNCDGSLLWKSSTRRVDNSSVRVPGSSRTDDDDDDDDGYDDGDLTMTKSRTKSSSSIISVEANNRVVLVVDDSSLVLKTTTRMLRKEGYIVETAQNGEEALELMKTNSYYFVMSDIQMPIMDGLDMTLNIREIERENLLDRVPNHIIGMSANSDAETRKQALTSGMDVFIPKPVRMLELVKWLPSTESV
jgi:signal transduction histidine kinase/CheY-like chemotaxis protein